MLLLLITIAFLVYFFYYIAYLMQFAIKLNKI